jgi:hypothetical protein
MANEIEVTNEKALAGELKKITATRALNRRSFMTAITAAAGAGMLAGCSSTNNTAQVMAAGPTQTDVLTFALNLEYLEATFYSYVVNGTDLPASVTLGSGVITGAPATKSVFTSQLITDLLGEIYYDELNHVLDLRSVLGSIAIARPALNLGAVAAITSANTIAIARQFEDVGVTAYAGAATLLTGTNLTYAAQILGVEGFHAGALRYVSIENPTLSVYVPADSLDVKPADPGTVALASAGPALLGVGSAATVSGFFATSGAATATSTTPAGFAFTRTTSQVLQIVYATAGITGTTKGGFFPNGMSGAIATS